MHCEQCGLTINSDGQHVCRQPGEKLFTLTHDFEIPALVDRNNTSLESTSLPLSDDTDTTLTIEEILNNKPKASGFISEVKAILATWKSYIKKPTKANTLLLIISGIAFILWFWSKYVSGNYSYMMPSGLKGIVSVLMGSFTNVPTRILHFSAMITLLTAYVPGLFTSSNNHFLANAKSSYVLIRKVLSYGKSSQLYVTLTALGAGLFFANYMMRNNSPNKYVPCFLLGLTILLSTSGLFNASFVRLIKGLFNDIARLLKIENKLVKYQLMVQIGFGSGLILSYIACLIRGIRSTSFTDNFAYYLGTVIVITGIILLVTHHPNTVTTRKEAQV